MSEIGDGHHEDVMRGFFRFYVGDIGKLLKKVADIVNEESRSSGRNLIAILPEANRIVVVCKYQRHSCKLSLIFLPRRSSSRHLNTGSLT